jgi:rubrerythrin
MLVGMGGRLEELLDPAQRQLFDAVRNDWGARLPTGRAPQRKLSLECSGCGYGIARAEPPERCPMCQAVDSWAHTPWRPFSDDRLP